MKIPKRFLACFLSLMMFAMPLYAFAGSTGDNYDITNPYKNVNFSTWKAYKTQLHCHTNASDGYLTIHEFVQLHYDLGYDIVALTDHGTINHGWNKAPQVIPVLRLVKYERTKMEPITPLTDEEYASYLNGTHETTNGTVRSNGMLDITGGAELNAATPVADCHLTSYFSNYGQGMIGVYGDYETPVAGVKADGGYTFLSHLGEYVYTKKDSAAHAGKLVDEYYVNKFAKIFIDNAGSCLGMGVNSATDEHTRCDRIMYDQILQKTIPNGVVPWCQCFADSHNTSSVNDAYTMNYMPELTVDAFKTSLIGGTFFSVSHYSNGIELNGMRELPEDCGNDDSLATPLCTNLVVDDANDTITVQGKDCDTITWISNGQVLKREALTEGGSSTLNLNDYNTMGCYVRFYITGKGGICYSQPLTVQEKGVTPAPVAVPNTVDVPHYLRALVTILDKLFFQNSVIVKIFKRVALGY